MNRQIDDGAITPDKSKDLVWQIQRLSRSACPIVGGTPSVASDFSAIKTKKSGLTEHRPPLGNELASLEGKHGRMPTPHFQA